MPHPQPHLTPPSPKGEGEERQDALWRVFFL